MNFKELSTRYFGTPGKDRPGPLTSEFWFSVGLAFLGVLLMLNGREDAGWAILAAVGVGYPVSRGITKS